MKLLFKDSDFKAKLNIVLLSLDCAEQQSEVRNVRSMMRTENVLGNSGHWRHAGSALRAIAGPDWV